MYLNPGGGPQMNPGGPMQPYPNPINPVLALIQRIGGLRNGVAAQFQPHQQQGGGGQLGHPGIHAFGPGGSVFAPSPEGPPPQRRVDPGVPLMPHPQAPGSGPQHGHGNLDDYTDVFPGFDPHGGGNPAHGGLAAIVAALGANHSSLDSFQGGGGMHSNFLDGLHPAAQQAVLKLIQRMNLGHMPVGVDAQGHTRPGYHSQSTHRANVAAGRTHVLKAY